MKSITPNKENVKLIGRTYPLDEALWCAFSGTGIEFDFKGSRLSLTLLADKACEEQEAGNHARYAVYLNGERLITGILRTRRTTLGIIDSEKPVEARVQVIKISECAMSTMGIAALETDDGAFVSPTKQRERRIEFIGDSITCGYGVDDENELHPFKTSTEDCTGAYAYKTAQLLDADYSLVSISGYGIISGYTATAEEKVAFQTVPQYYSKLGFSYKSFADKLAPQDIEWDFKQYIPQAVVINLGTNDDSYCLDHKDRQRDYTDNYKLFLREVRAKNPDAFIFCAVGIMGTRIFTALETAVNEYKSETGDDRIKSYCFTEQDHEHDGYAADYHPTRKTHDKAAVAFAPVIKETMWW